MAASSVVVGRVLLWNVLTLVAVLCIQINNSSSGSSLEAGITVLPSVSLQCFSFQKLSVTIGFLNCFII